MNHSINSSDPKCEPLVSVLMSVYNHADVVAKAMKNIVDQTYPNIEIIIIDDCSTDNSREIIEYFQKKDDRIVVIYNSENLGLAKSLNKGIQVSNGEFIARFDADDLYRTNRISLQVSYMCNNKHVDVLGSNAILIDEEGRHIGKTNLPIFHDHIIKEIPRRNPFIHSSVMARSNFFRLIGNYDDALYKKQDYDLWARGAELCIYENMPDFLIYYKSEQSKKIKTDLYGFFVRLRNGWRHGYFFIGLYWAFVTLAVNILRKAGYKQRAFR